MTEKIDKREEKQEAALTIRSQLQKAYKDGKKVNIFASGTYKGVSL